MSHQSELIASNIGEYLKQHEQKELLRMLTCGSVDDGKSTLIGRLLHDSKLIYEDHLEAVKTDSAKIGTVAEGLDLALLVDGLQAEREQGITIDVAYRYFSTAKRKFIIADTPGHEQYTRNMATGASTCDLAIILVDARHGVITQTKRHTFIATLLGIKHIIVAINKMDLVGFSETIYQQIKEGYADFSNKLDMADVRYIPLSALKGDNVVKSSVHMPWYEGAPLMTVLESIQISADKNLSDFRFPIQYVNRPNLDFRGYCGTIASGMVKVGDEVMVLSSRKTSKISTIVTYDGNLQEAFPPQAITLTLTDEIDISRGDMLVHPSNVTYFSDKLDAQIVWMGEEPMQIGKQYLFKQATKKSNGAITTLKFKTDVNSLEKISSEDLNLNEIGRCEITLSQRLAFDAYQVNHGTGAFIMIDKLTNVTVGAGMIVGNVSASMNANWHSDSKHTRLIANTSLISTAERQRKFDQKPKTILLTGLTGSGKSTLAYGLERKLFDLGHAAFVLDGHNMRLGPSRDLGFHVDARSENLRRSVEIAKLMNQAGIIVICSLVAPNKKIRTKTRELIGSDFLEVYLSAPLEVCQERDTTGIYQAVNNKGVDVDMVPSITLPYDIPDCPDLNLPTHEISIDESIERLVKLLEDQGAF